jgi:hypothetical protein
LHVAATFDEHFVTHASYPNGNVTLLIESAILALHSNDLLRLSGGAAI